MNRISRPVLQLLALALAGLGFGATARIALAETSAVPGRVSPGTAVARAMNALTSTPEGFVLSPPAIQGRVRTRGRDHDPAAKDRGGTGDSPESARRSVDEEGPSRIASSSEAVRPRGSEETGIIYARGPIEERYLFRGDHVEQQFVLHNPIPTGGAELVLAGEIACGGALEQADAGWIWRTEQGVVSLGQVHVQDARGRSIPASMSVDDRHTRITIAGRELAAAAYPVLVDPEIGANDFRLSDMGIDGDITFDGRNSAVAYNSVNNQYLVVWEGDDDVAGLVEGEFEIFGQRIDAATGAEIGANDFRISDMGPDGDADRTRFPRRWRTTASTTSTSSSGRATTAPTAWSTASTRSSASGSTAPPVSKSAPTTFASATWAATAIRSTWHACHPDVAYNADAERVPGGLVGRRQHARWSTRVRDLRAADQRRHRRRGRRQRLPHQRHGAGRGRLYDAESPRVAYAHEPRRVPGGLVRGTTTRACWPTASSRSSASGSTRRPAPRPGSTTSASATWGRTAIPTSTRSALPWPTPPPTTLRGRLVG